MKFGRPLMPELLSTIFWRDGIQNSINSRRKGNAIYCMTKMLTDSISLRRLISTLRLRFVSLLLFILCLINTTDAQISSAARDPKINSAIMIPPFADESGFSGKWKLSEEVPRYLSAYMSEKFRATFISPTTVQLFGETIGVVGN